jgi:chloramphenicol-sensitive protein RarD
VAPNGSPPASPAPRAPRGRDARDERARGFAWGLAAYLAWGLFPLYFKALREVPPIEVLAHRVVWSLALLAAIVAARGGRRALREAFRPRTLPVLAATGALIATNWLVYIWTVQRGHVLEGSLGYFVNPLVNVLLGVAFLGEALSRAQRIAVAIAAAGVAVLVVRAGHVPWVALVLALTFGLYAMLRKRAAVDALGGLLVETALLAAPALLYLAARAASGEGAFGSSAGTTLLLAAAGPITALPLVGFAFAVNRLRLSTIGLVQYVTPTSQFLLAVLAFREPFGAAHAVAFAAIWVSLALYSWDALARAPWR